MSEKYNPDATIYYVNQMRRNATAELRLLQNDINKMITRLSKNPEGFRELAIRINMECLGMQIELAQKLLTRLDSSDKKPDKKEP